MIWIGSNKFAKIDRFNMAKDDDEDLPDKDAAKGFYAKYEPKEILGRLVKITLIYRIYEQKKISRT